MVSSRNFIKNLFKYVFHTVADNCFYVIVRQGIKDGFTLPPVLYQIRSLEHAELVGNGALAQS